MEGTWGSGKSTVIKLLGQTFAQKNRQQNPQDTQLFTFDAWSHTGDPLRKAFLRELTDFLGGVKSGSPKWIEASDWQKKLTRITIPRDSVVKSSRPVIGNWIRALLVLAGAFIVLSNDRSVDVFDWLKDHVWTYVSQAASWLIANFGIQIGSLSVTSNPTSPHWKPVAVLFLFILLYLLVEGILGLKYRDAASKTSLQSTFVHPVALLLGRLPQEEVSETTKQGDATSVEFRVFFTELINECFSKDSQRTLVMVLDNLDRVRPEDALSIWSTMRLFFDTYEMSRTSWQKRLWVIVTV